MVTKYDMVTALITRHREFFREKTESVRFMILVTDPRNETLREIIKVTRDVSEEIPLTYLMRAPIELVTRLGSAKHISPKQAKPPMLPTPQQRQKKPLIVAVVDNDVPRECVSKANVKQVDKAPNASATAASQHSRAASRGADHCCSRWVRTERSGSAKR